MMRVSTIRPVITACVFVVTACATTPDPALIIQEAQAVDQIRVAARATTAAASALLATINTAKATHDDAVLARDVAFVAGGDTTSARRAEAAAATRIRAVTVSIATAAASADALIGAGSDAPLRLDISGSLSVVARFANGIAEARDSLDSRVDEFSSATQDVHEKSRALQEAVNERNTAIDALSLADSISAARASLDDAMAAVVASDVSLTGVLTSIEIVSQELHDASVSIERQLPVLNTPRRDLRRRR